MNTQEYIDQFEKILEDADIAVSVTVINKLAVLAVELQADPISFDEIISELQGLIPDKKIKEYGGEICEDILNEIADIIFEEMDEVIYDEPSEEED